MTRNPEVISSPVGLVPTNALVLTEPINSRMVGKPEAMARMGCAEITSGLPVTRSEWIQFVQFVCDLLVLKLSCAGQG
jgi:hypothetical protein